MRDSMLLMARMRGDEMTRQAGRSRLAARMRAAARRDAPRARTAPRLAPSWWRDFSAGFAARMVNSTRPARRAA